MKIVINKCYGGFGVSSQCLWALVERNAKCITSHTFAEYPWSPRLSEASHVEGLPEYVETDAFCSPIADTRNRIVYTMNRDNDARIDPDLIDLMEQKGSQWCSGHFAELAIAEIPTGVAWTIQEYDGIEWIAEKHRTWG